MYPFYNRLLNFIKSLEDKVTKARNLIGLLRANIISPNGMFMYC